MKADTLKVGTLGTCPVCTGEYKTRDGKLVHHGFKRPGDGMIHGDCFAVDYEPYERSTKGCADYKAVIARNLVTLEQYLMAIPTRTHYTKMGFQRGTVYEYALGVTDLYTWEAIVKEEIHTTKYAIKSNKAEIARMDALITEWGLKPLKVITEEQVASVTRALREARSAARAEINKIKADKAAALKAKRDAKAAEKTAYLSKFVSDLVAVNGDKTAARKLAEEFRSKKTVRKFGIIYYNVLNSDELLIKLGLAHREPDGWVRYTF